MKFSLVHPSRDRVARAEGAIREWSAHFSGTHTREHILSVDDDDPQLEAYYALGHRHPVSVVVASNRTMIEAVNRGAARATGDVLIVVSDDFGCPPAWDAALASVLDNRIQAAVLVNDGVEGRILTLPILTRAYYERLGYAYHPAYRSIFADDDLTWVARQDGVLIDARHLLFPHRHHSVGLSATDATYERQDSGEAWWDGWRVFEKRRAESFGRAPRDWSVRAAHVRIDTYYRIRSGGSRMRRRWIGRIPAAARRGERATRDVVLRLMRRALAVSPRE